MSAINEQIMALVKTFNGGGKVEDVIESAKVAGLPVKDAVRNWYLSTDNKLSKNKATALAKDAITIWWEARGKGDDAKAVTDLAQTHVYSHTRTTLSGQVARIYKPLPKIVVKNQGDVARLAVLVQKKDSIIEELMAEVKNLREAVKSSTITVQEVAVTPPAETKSEG